MHQLGMRCDKEPPITRIELILDFSKLPSKVEKRKQSHEKYWFSVPSKGSAVASEFIEPHRGCHIENPYSHDS